MRRPLNWLVVSISLMVLFANQIWAERPVEQVVTQQRDSIPVLAAPIAASAAPSPFAYVREDGTQEFVPTPPVPAVLIAPRSSFEDAHARDGLDRWVQGDPRTAVYTWSSPVLERNSEPASY
jgi:hypothetical protein